MKGQNHIFKKFIKGTLSLVELSIVMRWLDRFRHPESRELTEDEIHDSLARFEQRVDREIQGPRVSYVPYAAAALLLCFLSIGVYYFSGEGDGEASLAAVGPAEGKAVLTLSNGEQLSVGATLQDTVLGDYGIHVLQDEEYGLTIAQGGIVDEKRQAILYHTVKTPYGGVVRLQLEDGTVVDLNAGSTIRFPNTFEGNDYREIYLEGEAFLAVQRDEKKPFIVRAAQQSVEVLGTRFSINTQKIEVTKTTLQEGSVRVFSSSDPSTTLTLVPGEQALFTAKGLYKKKVNLDKELDWKNNDFYFEDSSIGEVMDKIAHWYDVDVAISPARSKVRFTGIISRKRSLKEVLDFLSNTEKMTYKLKERRLYVE
ncbi:FecR family protein [Sphingobacterium paucimobilis]|uniref:FecR protein domain-containing protein n=1 Tax=Sphingobacterium paucimobilis HER1398 TaxID=1346330 RepID=U2I0N2_9SPHI|nr:FecR domain-containing protein [Sphingobacterium paucimobilis]ERJ61367.1 hypothetical protein M472_21665 [Sphingobacterium paucimobilis HER1398]